MKSRDGTSTPGQKLGIFIFILLGCFANASHSKGVLIIGDSLSAMEDSWPSHITGHHIGLIAQGGRSIRDFDPPRDLFAGLPFTTVIYFLGSNDAAQGYPTYRAHMQFKTQMEFLRGRQFQVIVVLPPHFTKSPYDEENFVKIRREMTTICGQMSLVCHDSMEVWSNDLLVEDGVHPKPALSRKLASWLQKIIDSQESGN